MNCEVAGCVAQNSSGKGRSAHYIVDFVCDEAKLIIEIDGGQHGIDATKADDFVRTRWLEARGFRVLRFWNPDVLENIEGVLSAISEELTR